MVDESAAVSPAPAAAHAAEAERERRLVIREFLASGLYVSLVLLAALVAVPEELVPDDVTFLGLVGGSVFGLTLAHWFAFRLAAGMTTAGADDVSAGREAFALLAGASCVVVLAALPFLVADGPAAHLASQLTLAALPALAGAAIARLKGRPWHRVLLSAATVFAVALVIVAIKIAVGH